MAREAATGRTDFLVGLFILVSLGVILGAMILTSGVLEGRYDIHMRAAAAEGLTSDTRVMLQGLAIGRVKQVNPHLDPETSTLSFVATLSIREKFADGTRLALPRATRAVVAQPAGIVGAPVVVLHMPPPERRAAILEPGDTIESQRDRGMMDVLGEVASTLREDIAVTLEETRRLLTHTTQTVDRAGAVLASAGPRLDTALAALASSLERTDAMLATLAPRMGPMADTLAGTLDDARTVVRELAALTSEANGIAADNRRAIGETIEHLHRTAVMLEHFTERVTRRPLRMLTGVRPPPDTTEPPR